MGAAFFSSVWARLAAIGTALATVAAIYLRGRQDARRDAELRARRAEDERRRQADVEAERYRRAGGAADRLRAGKF